MSASRTSPRAIPASPQRVLVVDSDPDNRELYRDSLTLAGWQVTEAGDGREALVAALCGNLSVVLTELRLPLVDGISLCQILRRDHVTAAVPILVVTGETRATELERAHRAGADAVLIKPSTPDIIIAEMHRLISRVPGAAENTAVPLTSPATRRTALVKEHRRIATTTPAEPPGELTCPLCGRRLRYEQTFIGGVSRRHPERWDYFQCGTCGQFQYRYRTRKLRQIP